MPERERVACCVPGLACSSRMTAPGLTSGIDVSPSKTSQMCAKCNAVPARAFASVNVFSGIESSCLPALVLLWISVQICVSFAPDCRKPSSMLQPGKPTGSHPVTSCGCTGPGLANPDPTPGPSECEQTSRRKWLGKTQQVNAQIQWDDTKLNVCLQNVRGPNFPVVSVIVSRPLFSCVTAGNFQAPDQRRQCDRNNEV